MLLSIFMPASLLVTSTSANMVNAFMDSTNSASVGLERRQPNDVRIDSMQTRAATLEARQADPKADLLAAWDEDVITACAEALSRLREATNPSGTCICYNLPSLDNSTGAFEADLRLFQLSAPRAQFSGVPQQDIQVTLSYRGSAATPVSQTAAPRDSPPIKAENGQELRLLQTYQIAGQIDTEQMPDPSDMAQLEALIMPTVTLRAVQSSGEEVSTTVSANEAVFVQGVFSDNVVLSDFAVAQVAVDEVLNGVRNGTVAFVLPGTDILILPIGLVITSIWLVVGVAAYGYGTVMRIQYAEMYKRQAQRVAKGAVSRI